ncbi:BsuPI-related putative proteinase inhibitor [Metabacillus sp. 113a]|uniref:BsuPI-related putative proteinase inhibitor n=1 Tax=Metabacillus sp. 113a TaxID=3404706 RepID=UPI003CF2C53B
MRKGQIVLHTKAECKTDHAILKLILENQSDQSKTFTFFTGRKYDFTVSDSEGKTVYSSSKGKMFTQVIQELTIEPGQAKEYQETWEYSDAFRGTFTVKTVFLGQSMDEEKIHGNREAAIHL